MIGKIKQKLFTVRINKIANLKTINDKLNLNYIWGLGQSGTFLLYDLIACSKNFSFFGILPPRKKGFFANAKLAPLKLAPHEGQDFFFDLNLFYKKYNSEILFQKFIKKIDLDVSHIKKTKSLYSNIYKLTEKYVPDLKKNYQSNVLDKCPNYLLTVNLLKSVYPKSKHIFVIRDPRSTLISSWKRFTFTEEYFKKENNILKNDFNFYSNIFLEKWKKYNFSYSNNCILQFSWLYFNCFSLYKKFSKDILVVHFEDLLKKPLEILFKSLQHFNISDINLDYFRDISKNINKDKLTQKSNLEMLKDLKLDKDLLKDFNILASELGYHKNKLGKVVGSKSCYSFEDYKISKKKINNIF